MHTIQMLKEENDLLHKQIAYMRYYNSDKGQTKIKRNNEKRKNKTKYNYVVRQIQSLSSLTKKLSNNDTSVHFKHGRSLRFL